MTIGRRWGVYLSVWITIALSLRPATSAPHGDHHRPPGSAPLDGQLEQVRHHTARYRDHRTAVLDGFRRFGDEAPLVGEHWYHPDRARRPLDLEHPSTLLYARIRGRMELVGVAFTVYRRPGEPMPEGFAGNLDRWHVHDVEKIARALAEGRPLLQRLVDERIRTGRLGGGEGRTLLTMTHAWVWLPNPDGAFAHYNRVLPYLKAGLPASDAQGGTLDAAWGIALLTNACPHDLRVLRVAARADTEQLRVLREACAAARARVRTALQAQAGPEALNAAAERAWRGYVAARDRILTEEQKARVRVWVEPDTLPHP
ncbi:MAG: hypothetical protein QN193_09020 [Armatimonadota bacterium]|nr:hypothetical protein [Armatimonadota bacterium]MDR7444377.1 hypothetical protein [Armatimonadota bacterium]MDR7570734.1 hypothetical protein [Armatimonadota bacterium]MDR7614864.1 hypothetical protein [Armatimonadota bacterium]